MQSRTPPGCRVDRRHLGHRPGRHRHGTVRRACGLLGADLDSPEILAARADYEEAVAAFTTLAAEKADLTSLFVYADGEFEYVANSEDGADLAMYREFGLEELSALPTYGRLPAVESGQMGARNQDFIHSYQGLAAALDTMIATLQDAAAVTP